MRPTGFPILIRNPWIFDSGRKRANRDTCLDFFRHSFFWERDYAFLSQRIFKCALNVTVLISTNKVNKPFNQSGSQQVMMWENCSRHNKYQLLTQNEGLVSEIRIKCQCSSKYHPLFPWKKAIHNQRNNLKLKSTTNQWCQQFEIMSEKQRNTIFGWFLSTASCTQFWKVWQKEEFFMFPIFDKYFDCKRPTHESKCLQAPLWPMASKKQSKTIE